MKKGIIFMLPAVVFSALMLGACGEKYTPLTEAEKTAKVDSVFNEQKEAKLTELNAACQAGAEAAATAKFETMKAEAAAATASK